MRLKLLVPLYSPTSNIWQFQLLHIRTNIWCCIFLILAILVYVKWYLNAVLICIFLMTTDAEYTFSQVHVPFIRILL